MSDISQASPRSASVDEKIAEKNKTPSDICNSLFKNLLKKNSGDESIKGVHPLEKLDKKMRLLGLPAGQLFLPEAAIPQVIQLLENQGLGQEKIDQIILSITDSKGFLHLDKLMARLSNGNMGDRISENAILFQARHIPQVEELLFKMGLEVGQVKEIVEKSVNTKGELALDRLSSALEKFLPGSSSSAGLISLFGHFGIKGKPKAIDNGMIDPDLKKEFRHFSETASQDIQKKIKQNIAGLLREKGVPTQEVKSFLETLSVGYTKSILKGMNPRMPEPADLLNRVVIRSQPEWHMEGWQEKIVAILKNEHLLITKGLEKNWFQEEAPIQFNLKELFNKGKHKSETIFLHTNLAIKNRQPLEVGANQQKKGSEGQDGKKHDPKGGSLPKEALKNPFVMPKIEKNPLEVDSANQARNPNRLPQPLPKILDRMIWMIQANKQKGRISISPPELGRLDLNLVIKHGHLQANLSAENLMVKELIEENLNQLKQQLSSQGFVVDKFEVTVGLDDKRFRDGEMWTSGGRKGSSFANKSETEGDTLKVETEQIRPSIDNPYQIDVHV